MTIRILLGLFALSVAANAQSYAGYVDYANCSSIGGWAWDSTQPNTPISVDIFDGTTPIANVPANIFRQDLLNSGKGNGVHGFVFNTPSILKDNKTHYLVVKFGGTTTTLGYGNGNFAVTCSPAGGYQYYSSDTLTSVDTTKWYQNGTVSAGTGGLTSSDPNGGSLISKIPVPDGTSDYEVKTTLTLVASGGTYVTYLRGTPNGMSGPASLGTTYAIELQNPTFNGANCSAVLAGYKISSGSVAALSSTTVPCRSGMTIRVVYTSSGAQIAAYVDNAFYYWSSDGSILSGQPGVGVRNAPAGNSIAQVQLGPLDRVAPGAVATSAIKTALFPDHVDMKWTAAPDDANGTGVAFFHVVKNGGYVDTYNVPQYTDRSVTAGTSYSYQIQAFDFHLNSTASATLTVTAPPAGSVDPRHIGVRPLSTYWGGGGENIDLESGNLNFTIPLLKAKGRGNWSAGFNLSYNSENWRSDSSVWNLGADVGYGYGWSLQAGALRPYWSTFMVLDHYEFTDATGANYSISQTNGVWRTKEGVYVTFDPSTGRLNFPDGSFWVFGCTSAASEQDAGAMYPTLMQDSNGNQVIVTYMPGSNTLWNNSSARVQLIEDVRAQAGSTAGTYWTYNFNYNTDVVPHLTSITNNIFSPESYLFSISGMQNLISPFDGTTVVGSTNVLQSISYNGLGLNYQFTNNASGELTKVVFPYGGYLRWAYYAASYNGARSQREIQGRYLSKDGTAGSEQSYVFGRDPADNTRSLHLYATIDDPDGKSRKDWWFAQSGSAMGLVYEHIKREKPSNTDRAHDYYYYYSDSVGNLSLSSVVTALELGTSNQLFKRTDQSIDIYGNMTGMSVWDYRGDQSWPSTPARSYTNNYLSTTNYTSRNIYNRLVSSTVTSGATTTTLVTNNYDSGVPANVSNMREHDNANYGQGFYYRGNLTSTSNPGGTTTFSYDIGGSAVRTSVNGHITDSSITSTTNYAVPSSLTTGTLTTNLTYSTFLGPASTQGPNGETASVGYDTFGRPQSTTSPTGTTTTYTYATSAPWTVIATTNGKWSRKTLDGFGRTVKVETGSGATTNPPISVVETTYDACGCSPLGKIKQVSMPHAPGAAPVWTVYSYDGLGRTTTVTNPDGSYKYYQYLKNVVQAGDEAGKWKNYSSDVFGNLTSVVEPDPANPATATYTTNYTYDLLNHLISVNMPRPTGTQTRTFNYGNPPGGYLISATNPENGTVSYTYNSDGTLATKTDAKNQQIQYGYDSYGRVTQIRHYPTAGGAEDTCQQVNFAYDSNAIDGTFSQYVLGRLATRTYSVCVQPTGVSTPTRTDFTDMYSYTQPGQTAKKRLRVARLVTPPSPWPPTTVQQDLDGSWTYDNEGKMTAVTYPAANGVAGASYSFGFDAMSRPQTMTDVQNGSLPVITTVTYGPANELLTMTGASYSETRAYNSRLQLTQLNTVSFAYSTNQNNGKIQSQTDSASAETITYQYDALNRLISASSNQSWGQGFGYDGFGNLTQKTALAGSVPTFSAAVDAATNRLIGWSYDQNGNQLTYNGASLTYDVENRVAWYSGPNPTPIGAGYGYDPENRRVYKSKWNYDQVSGNYSLASEEVYYWGVTGQKMATYSLAVTVGQQSSMTLSGTGVNAYFGSKLIRKAAGNDGTTWTAVQPDRLGSFGKYYPYGEDRPTSTANNTEKFATYYRDGESGLDYAVNRFFNNVSGRFMSPDPYKASAGAGDPAGWNRYGYVEGDPIGFYDPSGLFISPGGKDNVVLINCEMNNYWLVNHDMYCIGYPGYSPPPPAPKPVPKHYEPECFAQLKYRDVDDPFAKMAGAVHTFWWVQDATGQQFIISGGYQTYQGSTTQFLEAWVVSGSSNRKDNAGQKVAWASDLSSEVCAQVAAMLAAAEAFPRHSIFYQPVLGPNSNSVAHYFALAAGFWPTVPTTAYGWNNEILVP